MLVLLNLTDELIFGFSYAPHVEHRNYLIQLEETNVVGVVFETTTAHVQTVFSDQTMVISADAAIGWKIKRTKC